MRHISENFCLWVARGKKPNFYLILINLIISLVPFIWFFLSFCMNNIYHIDLDWCIKLIIWTPIEHDFMGQKVKLILDFGRFDYILSFPHPILLFLEWMILASINCILLIILTPIEHNFWGWKSSFCLIWVNLAMSLFS